MNKYIDRILSLGIKSDAKIIIPEDKDFRVKQALVELQKLGFELVKSKEMLHHKDKYLEYINSLAFTKNWPKNNLVEYLDNPLNFSMSMVACNDADCLIAGAITPSSEVIRAAIRVIGIKPKVNCVSSIFLMISPDGKRAFTFADCAVIPEPDSNQLVSIASESADFHFLLTNEIPKVAFLSFSTKGSANHYRVDKVKDATKIFNNQYPNIIHDGELQVDTALDPVINKMKVLNSPIKGDANVLIFPNLDAGNIAYKLTQKLAGYTAFGPLLQGLKKPVHDLSRGCTKDDIVNIAAIAALQKDIYANI